MKLHEFQQLQKPTTPSIAEYLSYMSSFNTMLAEEHCNEDQVKKSEALSQAIEKLLPTSDELLSPLESGSARTNFMFICEQGLYELVWALLEHNRITPLLFSSTNDSGETPLHILVKHQQFALISTLLADDCFEASHIDLAVVNALVREQRTILLMRLRENSLLDANALDFMKKTHRKPIVCLSSGSYSTRPPIIAPSILGPKSPVFPPDGITLNTEAELPKTPKFCGSWN